MTTPDPAPAEQLTLFDPVPPALPPARAAGAPLRLGVLVSGRGAGLQALLDARAAGTLAAEVTLVVANHSTAPALDVATRGGVATQAVPRAGCPSRLAQQRQIAALLDAAGVHLVVLDGFDRVLEAEIVARYHNRIINTHPALLPAFGGLHAVADAVGYGVRVTGVTVHFVTAAVGAGPIILQEAVAVAPEDTTSTLAARIQAAASRLLPEAVALFAAGRLAIEGRRVIVTP